MGNVDQISPHDWLEMMFEFEYCDECHGDEKDHEAITVMGNYFAVCKPIQDEDEECAENHDDCGGPLERCSDREIRCDAHADAFESTR